MDEPFVMLARSFFDHALWLEKRSFSRAESWLDLVQIAAYQPRKTLVKGAFIEVPRGGIVASVRFLSDRWKWSRTKVCAYLDLLESENMIKRQVKGHETTVILLCNFDKYNTSKETPKRQTEDTGETPGRQIEEGKEGKEKENPHPAGAREDHPPDELLTEEQAVAQATLSGVAADFARYIWQSWAGRDGKDGSGVKVRFAAYLKKRWNTEGAEWDAGTHNGKRKNHANNHNENATTRRADRAAKNIPPEGGEIRARVLRVAPD